MAKEQYSLIRGHQRRIRQADQRHPMEQRSSLRMSLERFADDSAEFLDVGSDVAAASRQAYLRARSQELSVEEIAAAMTNAVDDLDATRAMAARAIPLLSSEVRNGIRWDIGLGIIPPLGLIALLGLFASLLDTVIQFRVIAFIGVLFALIVIIVLGFATGAFDHSSRILRLGSLVGVANSPALTSSAGALVVGLVIFGLGGAQLSIFTKSREAGKLERLASDQSKVDDAVAIAVAGLMAKATPERVGFIVKQETGVGWKVEQTEVGSRAVVTGYADLRESHARLRYASESSGDRALLESYLLQDGKEQTHRRYLVGKVVELADATSDTRKVTLKLDSSLDKPRVFTLPYRTFPPTIGTKVVAVEGSPGELSYLQDVDGVFQKFSSYSELHRSGQPEAKDLTLKMKSDEANHQLGQAMLGTKK